MMSAAVVSASRAQITRRLMHWASRPAADMEGVGDVWIEKLAEDGILRSRADFYTKITTELLTGYERMGEVSARNMVDSIAGSKDIGLRRALIGLAIPMASEGTAARLCRAGYRSLEAVADAGEEALQQVEDIGPKVAAILSVIESCRRLGLPAREYLASILPGLANRPLQQVSRLTPAAWEASRSLKTKTEI